jgi:hypothetical protein
MDNQLQTLLDENAKLKVEIELLKKDNEEIQARLKKYINNDAHKKYYENHKQEVKETHYKYIDKMKAEEPEKYKQYRKDANQRYRDKKKLNTQIKIEELIS